MRREAGSAEFPNQGSLGVPVTAEEGQERGGMDGREGLGADTTARKARPASARRRRSKGRTVLKERSPENQECPEHERERTTRVSCSGRKGNSAAVNLPDWPMTLVSTDAELHDPETKEQKHLPPTPPGRPPRHGSERHGPLSTLVPPATHLASATDKSDAPLKFR